MFWLPGWVFAPRRGQEDAPVTIPALEEVDISPWWTSLQTSIDSQFLLFSLHPESP